MRGAPVRPIKPNVSDCAQKGVRAWGCTDQLSGGATGA